MKLQDFQVGQIVWARAPQQTEWQKAEILTPGAEFPHKKYKSQWDIYPAKVRFFPDYVNYSWEMLSEEEYAKVALTI